MCGAKASTAAERERTGGIEARERVAGIIECERDLIRETRKSRRSVTESMTAHGE
jgi:hypothetical protein